ncbi:GTPase IMAP family member 4-like [Babylonia areolata]|uniref:GTPase IMAP family member 4-like n=1 Tax=Babylonia areolata TaxID=304850 RepID=UPI003FD03DF3
MSNKKNRFNILIVGNVGSGKSTVGNTLLGEEKFPVGRGMSMTTTDHQCHDLYLRDMMIRVIDTPDITVNKSESDQREEVRKWKRSLLKSFYSPFVLVTVRCDVSYTEENFSMYQKIKKYWGCPSLSKALNVAYTFGDCQGHNIHEYVRNPPSELKKLLEKAKNRHLVFTNKDHSSRPVQAEYCFSRMEECCQSCSCCC